MRVLVAGATGVIGRPLVEQLRQAGHEVVGTTRSDQRAQTIRELGGEPVVVDARDTDALRRAVVQARPEVVINQLTNLPQKLNYRRAEETFGPTTELRGMVGPALAGAAAEAGARRLIAQSVCFFYASTGKAAHGEDDPLIELPPELPAAQGVIALETLERATVETPGLEGVVLRYGFFYGPGSAYASDGAWAEDVRRRRFPIIGRGSGVFSYVHMDDAVSATIAALDRGSGVYNVCDDDPAPMSEWLPAYAEALSAKPPRRVPAWLAGLLAGKQAVAMATALEGASNEKAKRELDWQPRYPSWRQGFGEALG
ncbi:MAG: NAD(P)-dependent oxidoreductase [Solirubrobacterales bacterium]